jgi:hypothetical protein
VSKGAVLEVGPSDHWPITAELTPAAATFGAQR